MALPRGKSSIRSRQNYDQLETFRQVGILVEGFAMTRDHPAMERAAEFLFSFQTDEGDFRGIYGNQYATTYVGAITELLVKAGYANDQRVAHAFRWLLSMRQTTAGGRSLCARWVSRSLNFSIPSGTQSRSSPTHPSLPPTW
jgi:squalene cyclase